MLPDGFPESALDTIPDYGVPQSLADHKRESAVVKTVCQIANHQQPVCGAGPFTVDLGMPFRARNPVPPLHHEAPFITQSAYGGP